MSLRSPKWWVLAFLAAAGIIAIPGLHGSWILDDFENIVNNSRLYPAHLTWHTLVAAAFSSPSSPLHRPLSDLTFLFNFETTGANPFWFKLTNLVIRLINGMLGYFLVRGLFDVVTPGQSSVWRGRVAAVVMGAWILAPINQSTVFYVVQRMQLLSTLFILLSLLAYLAGRRRMMAGRRHGWIGMAGMVVLAGIGVLAKEDAVLAVPMAAAMDIILFRGRGIGWRRLAVFFTAFMVVPGIIGLVWLLPGILSPASWAIRGYTLGQRLLTEGRVVTDYLSWTLMPTASALSFYHDNIVPSAGLLSPPSTLISLLTLGCLVTVGGLAWRRAPLVSLGIAWFLVAQTLTGTIIPLELAYEHRNDFASLGVMLAMVPLLLAPGTAVWWRRGALAALLAWSMVLDVRTSRDWSNPTRLNMALYLRNPASGRACYGVANSLIHNVTTTRNRGLIPITNRLLEQCMHLRGIRVLAAQGLIVLNSRMDLPVDPAWWHAFDAGLAARIPNSENIAALRAVIDCQSNGQCRRDLPQLRLAVAAALRHGRHTPNVLQTAALADIGILNNPHAAMRLSREAVHESPHDIVMIGSYVRIAAYAGHMTEARRVFSALTPFQRAALGGLTWLRLNDCVKGDRPGPLCPP